MHKFSLGVEFSIISSLQIENEFGSWPTGTSEHAYAMWAAKMAVSTKTGVPWIMCLQFDAPDPIVSFGKYS